MITNNFKWPPEGKRIYVSLRESNGEHGIYECIFLGMGSRTFLFTSNKLIYPLCNQDGVPYSPKESVNLSKNTYLCGKPFISWWIPKKKKEVQNDSTSTIL